MQDWEPDRTETNERPYWIVPVTDRHYMVVRSVNRRQETSPGVYGSHKLWRTYITSVGANYWMSLPPGVCSRSEQVYRGF